jgi:O-antigen ligase
MQETKVSEKKEILSSIDIISIIILFCYLSVNFVSNFSSYSVAEPQWLYLNILNLIVTGYILYDRAIIADEDITKIFKSKIIILYGMFFGIYCISYFVAFNKAESLLKLIHFLIAIIAFFNLYFLFLNKKHLFIYIAIVSTIILFFESIYGLNQILKGYAHRNYLSLVSSTIANHGNKNIFTANILLKLPLLMYCILHFDKWKRKLFIVSLFLSSMLLFLLNTRALICGFLLMLIVSLVLLRKMNLTFKNVNIKYFNKAVIITILVSLSLSIVIIKNGRNDEGDNALDRLTALNLDDSSLQARLNFWKSSVDYITKHPALGSGAGNWKIASMPYEQKWKKKNTAAIHMHNDFLEVAAESGIVNGLIYLTIFILLLYVNIKKILEKDSLENSIIRIIVFISILGYCIDSFFNFPLSRPTIQINLILLLILSLDGFWKKDIDQLPHNNIATKKTNVVFLIFCLSLSILTLNPSFKQYKFYKAINAITLDEKTFKLSFDEVNQMIPDFPNLNFSGIPIIDYKARYLIKEQSYDKALQYLNESKKYNPNSLFATDLISEIYTNLKLTDSALKYNKILLEKQPNYSLFYEKYIQDLSVKADTATILKSYKKVDSTALKPQHFAATFKFLLNCGYDPIKSFSILKEGNKKFPKDTLLNRMTHDFKNLMAQKKQPKTEISNVSTQKITNQQIDFNNILEQYQQLLKNNPNDYTTIENIGICYYQLKKYNEALPYLTKVADAKVFQNGKSEYTAAACYHYLKNGLKSCEYAKIASEKGYNKNDTDQLIKAYCK